MSRVLEARAENFDERNPLLTAALGLISLGRRLDALLAASVVSHPVGVERQVERIPELEPDTVRLLARRIPPAEPEVEVVDAICLTGMEAGLD